MLCLCLVGVRSQISNPVVTQPKSHCHVRRQVTSARMPGARTSNAGTPTGSGGTRGSFSVGAGTRYVERFLALDIFFLFASRMGVWNSSLSYAQDRTSEISGKSPPRALRPRKTQLLSRRGNAAGGSSFFLATVRPVHQKFRYSFNWFLSSTTPSLFLSLEMYNWR